MKKILTTIIITSTAVMFSSCQPPAPVHVHDINVVKVPPKPKVKPKKKYVPKKKVYVKPKDNPEDFRALSH